MSEDLKQENENLKKQLASNQQGIDGLTAQLDAHRELLNENLQAGLNFRINVHYLKKQNALLSNQLADTKKQLEEINAQLEDATKRLLDLQTKA